MRHKSYCKRFQQNKQNNAFQNNESKLFAQVNKESIKKTEKSNAFETKLFSGENYRNKSKKYICINNESWKHKVTKPRWIHEFCFK